MLDDGRVGRWRFGYFDGCHSVDTVKGYASLLDEDRISIGVNVVICPCAIIFIPRAKITFLP